MAHRNIRSNSAPRQHHHNAPCSTVHIATATTACAARTRHAAVAQAQAVEQRRHAVPAGQRMVVRICIITSACVSQSPQSRLNLPTHRCMQENMWLADAVSHVQTVCFTLTRQRDSLELLHGSHHIVGRQLLAANLQHKRGCRVQQRWGVNNGTYKWREDAISSTNVAAHSEIWDGARAEQGRCKRSERAISSTNVAVMVCSGRRGKREACRRRFAPAGHPGSPYS